MTYPTSSTKSNQQTRRPDDSVKQSIQLFQAGRHDEAERILRKVLKGSPTNPDALQVMGLIAAQKGKLDTAEELLRRAVALAPKHAAAHINLGNVLISKRQISDAAAVYARAIELAPNAPQAHYNYARCLRALGRLDAALATYRRAIELAPNFLEARINLGAVLCELEAYEEAEGLYRDLLAERPDVPDLKLYLGDVLRFQGRPEQARAQYESLLTDRAEHPHGRLVLGLALLDENEIDKAAHLIEEASQEGRLPRPEILSALAALRLRQGHKEQAIVALSEAIEAGSNSPQHHLTLANWLAEVRQRDRALEVLEQSLVRYGDYPASLLGQLVFNQRHLCDWRHWEKRVPMLVERIRGSDRSLISPFAAQSLPGLTAADLQQVSRAHAARFQAWTERALVPRPPTQPGGRLRIGYLSADFHAHATAYLMASVFERHVRDAFEVFAYSWGPDDASPMRQRLLGAFEHFVEIGSMSFMEAARRIREDKIDILIDLKGYTRDARTEILALRPSPIQVTWWGFPGTMGAPFVDYIVVDPVVVPEDQAACYDESLAYLPNAYAPVDDRRHVAAIPTKSEAGLPEDGFVFCCFNNPYKITPELFDRWCNLLRSVPGAVLWLFASNDSAPRHLVEEAEARGIAAERLVFAPKLAQAEHLARLSLADLCLDTLPYNAHTTASDALWVGVPMLTCPGESFPSRVAASLLTAAGVPELIADDLDDYEERARFLALHPAELATSRSRIRAAKEHAAFFQSERFTRNLEALLGRMWTRHEQGLQPERLEPINVCD